MEPARASDRIWDRVQELLLLAPGQDGVRHFLVRCHAAASDPRWEQTEEPLRQSVVAVQQWLAGTVEPELQKRESETLFLALSMRADPEANTEWWPICAHLPESDYPSHEEWAYQNERLYAEDLLRPLGEPWFAGPSGARTLARWALPLAAVGRAAREWHANRDWRTGALSRLGVGHASGDSVEIPLLGKRC